MLIYLLKNKNSASQRSAPIGGGFVFNHGLQKIHCGKNQNRRRYARRDRFVSLRAAHERYGGFRSSLLQIRENFKKTARADRGGSEKCLSYGSCDLRRIRRERLSEFSIDRTAFVKTTLDKIAEEGEKYGSDTIGAGKTICIDYSSINIAKPFHIGHLSTTVLGGALYRILSFLGYKTVGINHLGDYGTQFGKLISAYKRWGDKETVQKGGIRALNELYVRFHREAETDPALDDEARAYFKKSKKKTKNVSRFSVGSKNLR